MRTFILCLYGALLAAASADGTRPIASPDLVFEERDGLVAVEAEHFIRQEKSETRAWHLVRPGAVPALRPDADPPHLEGASGGAYLEILPDTRRNHGEKLVKGENFMNQPGEMAVLSYRVHFNTAGTYYVWARIFSTGTEDNGCHVGIDGTWPKSGQRMQWTAKQRWAWGSKQRTEQQHGGERYKLFLEVDQPGTHTISFSMREDGFEMDRWLMTTDRAYVPEGMGPPARTRRGTPPPALAAVAPGGSKPSRTDHAKRSGLPATAFPIEGSNYYLDQGKWLAIDPKQHRSSSVSMPFPYPSGVYHLRLHAVGEDDGSSRYAVRVDGETVGAFTSPLSRDTTEEGPRYTATWRHVRIRQGQAITVVSECRSVNGEDFSRGRWSLLELASADGEKLPPIPAAANGSKSAGAGEDRPPLHGTRRPDGDGGIHIGGELKTWHPVTLTLDGPYAHERDVRPNPFTDYAMRVRFRHASGSPDYTVPGYFAADGMAGESGAAAGTSWRAHLSPDKPGRWHYQVAFARGVNAALDPQAPGSPLAPFDGKQGAFTVSPGDKTGRDLRGKGRLQYVGKHHLRHAGNGEYFLKAGADAPETLLAFKDFDATTGTRKSPLKAFAGHVRDWNPDDPTWRDGRGKGLIGAINYLASTGCNAFSFLTYNAGGDGDNVWPFIARDAKRHYDCSKLDQWRVVFEHAQTRGMYLHFKLQETENDDRRGKGGKVPAALDGGALGPERRLYCRELVARFGHLLALNWNLGEENTQSTAEQKAMAAWIDALDPYDHLIVVHTYPNRQDAVYRPLLGGASALRGASLQNSHIRDTHAQTVKWVRESAKTGVPWVVAFDESGSAAHGQPPDLGYRGFDGRDRSGKRAYTEHEVRRQTLWGALMGGGAGVEYYFGYQFAENDLVCEDWRSRDRSWRYAGIALRFFHEHGIPFWNMRNADALAGNPDHGNAVYVLAEPGSTYLVYLPGGDRPPELDLTGAPGGFDLHWFNPRKGGPLRPGAPLRLDGGARVRLGPPPADPGEDWLAVIRKR